jgi:8-oxo-dGTP pyrophosphatase MutT (NUDIX family)
MNTRLNDNFCQNCGKQGHVYQQCKIPITSFGIICFRKKENQVEYLMIRRKDTLGYIDFLRGKYSLYNKYYLMNMLKQMTIEEKESLKTKSFDVLWRELWGDNALYNKYKNEEMISREKFNQLSAGVYFVNPITDEMDNNYGSYSRWSTKKEIQSISYTLQSLIEESMVYEQWDEQEWGFPKGRRNYQEKEHECALREFSEETGYDSSLLKNIENILPFEEIFMGSNYKSYKHKYYLMYMHYDDTNTHNDFEKSEVSKIDWKNYETCLESIRSYNTEKKKIITYIHKCLAKYTLCELLCE